MSRPRSFAVALLGSALVLAVLAGPASAAFPGKDGPIVYSFIHLNEDTDTGGLRVHGPTLKPRSKPLTRDVDDNSPAFSPNGQLIAFESNREAIGSASHIYVMKADGSGIRRLTSGAFRDSFPAFSADGKRVVFARTLTAPRRIHIYSVPLAGGEPTQLSTGPEDTEPVFTPNGKRILFTGKSKKANGASDIFSMSPQGNEVRLVVGGPGHQREADVSPNGRIIAFNSESNLYTARIDGSHTARITRNRGGCFDSSCFHYPSFSPDGTHLAFQRRGRISSDIYVSRVDGSNAKEFEEAGNGEEGFGTAVGAPAWGRALR
jgi:Tol biopolymer transport system component